MVKNSVYKGEFVAHRWCYEKVYSERLQRTVTHKVEYPPEEWIIVPVPAIVIPKAWELAQDALVRNRSVSLRNTKVDFLLVNLLKCAGCGYSCLTNVRSCRSGGKKQYYPSYRCLGRNNPTKVVREQVGCTQSQISSKKLDDAVWKVIMDILTEPANLGQALDDYYANSDVGETQAHLEFIDQQLQERQNEDERLYRAYMKGAFDEEELAERRREIKKAIQVLREERGKLSERVMTQEEFAEHKAQVAGFADRVRTKLLNVDVPFETKRRIVRMLVDHIDLNVNEGWFRIYGVLKGTFSVEGEDFETIQMAADAMPSRACF